MGNMLGYKLHGRGILLHDDGTSAITTYQHGNLSGHSLLIRKDTIVSMIAHAASHQSDIAMRKGASLLVVGIGELA